MIFSIAHFEYRYQTRSVATLVLFTVLLGCAFILTANNSEFVSTMSGGQVYINSPYSITLIMILVGIFATLITPSYMASAVLKDLDTHFWGILYATPVNKKVLLSGRFLGAFGALMTALAAVPMGMVLGQLWPWADPTHLAPLNLGHYGTVYFGFLLPSMLVVASFIFATAVLTRHSLATYLTAFSLLVIYMVVSETNAIGPIWDPFMHRILEETTRYQTAIERNTSLLGYNGLVLANRALWVTAAALLFVFALVRFKVGVNHGRTRSTRVEEQPRPNRHLTLKHRGRPTWNTVTARSQWWARTRFEVRQTLGSLPFIGVIVLSSFLVFVSLSNREVFYGLDAYPLTRLMTQAITGANWWALLIVLSFYSADILNRERACQFNQITDALPVSSRVMVSSKLIALLMIMNVSLVIGVALAVGIQFHNGQVAIEWGLYGEHVFLFFILPYLCLAVLACFFQVLAGNRLIGMVLLGLFILVQIVMNDLFGSEHPLLKYGLGGFPSPYSDMNGAGRFSEAGYWLRGYWVALAGLLLVGTYGLWQRGINQPLRLRLRGLWTRAHGLTALPLLALVGLTAGVIYYNTNILNTFYTSQQSTDLRVTYEQRFRQYEDLPMPRITDVKIQVDLFPHEGRAESRGSYRLENQTGGEIHALHLVFPFGSDILEVELPGAHESLRDTLFNYVILELDEPMEPGAVTTLTFHNVRQHKGFEHGKPDTALVGNGTFLTNNMLTPQLGFNPDYMLEDQEERRVRGLDPLPRVPTLEDTHQHNNSVNRQDSDFISFQTTISTVPDQIAVAPGKLQKSWVEGERCYFSYATDTPMMHFYAILSAEYEVLRESYDGIDIEIYHHQPHTYNLTRMQAAVKDSLRVFSQAFSPYQYDQVRILEFPAYRNFAQSFANTIPYSEGMGFVCEVTEADIDMPYYVTAHEMAHQWWGHQVTAANCQGASMLNETLAQYSALLVMEERYGPHKVRAFLAMELDRYLAGRVDDPVGEMPLYRVEGQEYIHYRKGSLVMYALRDYLGTEVVNRALQRLIALRAYQSRPYATSADFLRLLREEAGGQHETLISDLFERITLYDMKMESARVIPLGDGRFEVNLNVSARKTYADQQGLETEAEFDLAVDIGLFSRNPSDSSFSAEDVIMLEKHRVKGDTELVFVVDRRPVFAGIDPYHKLIDRNIEDNLSQTQ